MMNPSESFSNLKVEILIRFFTAPLSYTFLGQINILPDNFFQKWKFSLPLLLRLFSPGDKIRMYEEE